MTDPKQQRRGRRIAMTEAEVAGFLAVERTCRVATIGPDGPHATPLWFGWDGRDLWLHSVVRSQRWRDLQRDPRIGVVVDAGDGYSELRGVEISGTAEGVGEVPRTGAPDERLVAIETIFAEKYADGAGEMVHDGRHGWLRVTPRKIVSWDFRKLAAN
jgi:PPOX class probable F420-dependent enzyme